MDIALSLRKFVHNYCDIFTENGQSFIFDCPLCSGRRKLYIRKHDGMFICFKCKEKNHFSGKSEFALNRITGIDIDRIKADLYGLNTPGIQIDDPFSEDTEEIVEETSIIIHSWPLSFYPIDHRFAERGANYLESRGIPVDISNKYKIRFDPITARVYFPIFSGTYLVGWQGRSIYSDVEPKSLTSSGFEKSKFLMFHGLNIAEHMVLSEGPIDAIKADMIGGNVCTMGKIISPYQLKLIQNSGIKTLYLALDPDAYLEVEKLVNFFYRKVPLKIMQIPENKKDLGELSFQEAYDIFRAAKSLDPNRILLYLKE